MSRRTGGRCAAGPAGGGGCQPSTTPRPTDEPHRRLRRLRAGWRVPHRRRIRVRLAGGHALVPPVVGQQVIEHVVDGHRAEQVVLVVDDRCAHQVVGREEPGDVGQRGIRRQVRHLGVQRAGDQFERRLAEQPLGVHAAQVPAGRGGLRRAGRRTPSTPAPGVRSGERTRASASAMVASGVSTTGSGVIRPPADVRRVLQQPPHRRRLLRLHQPEQPLLDALGQLGEQVGRVVRVHRLQDVGGAGLVQMRQQLLLVVLGQFLDDVGQPVVVHRVGDLVPQSGFQVAQDACRVGRTQPLQLGQHLLRTADRVPGQLRRIHARGRRSSPPPAPGPGARSAWSVPGPRAGRPPSPGCGMRSIATSTTTAELARRGQLHLDAQQLARSAATPARAARTGAGSPIRSPARPRATPGCRPAASARRSAAGWAVRRPTRAPWAACDPAAAPPRCRGPCRSIRRSARTPAARPAARRTPAPRQPRRSGYGPDPRCADGALPATPRPDVIRAEPTEPMRMVGTARPCADPPPLLHTSSTPRAPPM